MRGINFFIGTFFDCAYQRDLIRGLFQPGFFGGGIRFVFAPDYP
jgi:hypothetical protein